MIYNRKLFLRINLMIFLIILISLRAFSCNCNGRKSIKEGFNDASGVILGEILSKEIVLIKESGSMPIPTSDSTYEFSDDFVKQIARYEVKIERVFKGTINYDTIEVYTGLGGGDCGIQFITGKKYLVFGYTKPYKEISRKDYNFPEERNILWTNICMLTTDNFKTEIVELDKLIK